MTHPALTTVLTDGELTITRRLLEASNATFLTELAGGGLTEGPAGDATVPCVYKPVQGERPLWDFPHGTLALREVAAYEVSRIGGFDVVPVTVLVDGPLGPGSLQAWVESEDDAVAGLVDLVPSRRVPAQGWFACVDGYDHRDRAVSVIHADDPRLRRLAVFDALINNADRKGGHILASQGHVFGVDHGISFHAEPKLRTLLWGWAGTELTDDELTRVGTVRDEAPDQLDRLLSEAEVDALVRRAERLLRHRRMPRPRGERPSIPWPPF